MLKRLFIIILLLISSAAIAQEGTISPYSFFGVGSLKFKGTVENRAMGGIGVYADSIHLNLQNPASAAGLRLVNYSIAGSHQYDRLATEQESQNATTTTLDYIALGIPMGKFGANFGLEPLTSTGYKLQNEVGGSLTQFEGSGGLNKAFLAIGYQVTPNFSIGIDANYNFGNIENVATNTQEDVELGSQEINRSTLLGFNFNLGAFYKTMISDNLEMMASVTYTPETDLISENERVVASIQQLPSGAIRPLDIREIDIEDTDLTFPSQFTLGSGIGKPKKWFLGAEYTSQKTSNFTNRSFDLPNVVFEDASQFSVGGFYIPNYNAFGNYFKRVVYRAGFRFEETGININNESINEFGISFGMGLPVGGRFSNINLGFEFGRRGTKNAGLVQETFFNTFISLSLNDKWFEKRYYD
ncbi:MAG: membrane protein [Aureisphaera sp.]